MRRRAEQAALLTAEAAREQCLRLLERRSRSSVELRRRLEARGFEVAAIEPVLADLARAGLVDDAEYARLWVTDRQASGLSGPHKWRWELRRKGIPEDLIRQVLDETHNDESEREQALDLARRRLREQPPDAKALLRLRRFLLGRGFGLEAVDAVMRRVSAHVEG